MVHYVLKNFKQSKLNLIAGEATDATEENENFEEDQINYYKLRLGDIIKFGRISYKIIQMHLPEQVKSQKIDE
jgi:hypothetical protein